MKGPKAFQVPLTSKPRLYDNLLEAARSLPVRDRFGLAASTHSYYSLTIVHPIIRLQVKPAVRKLTGMGVELVAMDADVEDGLLQKLFDVSDGSAR